MLYIKYLGVLMGDVSLYRAYSVPLATALHRAKLISPLGLSLLHRVQMLKQWVLPVLGLVSHSYWPTPSTVSALTDVYRLAPGLDSWGLTIPILSHLPEPGGCRMLRPGSFLYTQFRLLAMRVFTGAFSILVAAQNKFSADCQRIGVIVKPPTLLHFQLGPVGSNFPMDYGHSSRSPAQSIPSRSRWSL